MVEVRHVMVKALPLVIIIVLLR